MLRVGFTLGVLLATTAAAQTRWGLKWRAPEECVGAAELAQLVEEKLGRLVFGSDAQFRVEGNLQKAAAPLWKARVTVVSRDGEVLGTRELISNDSNCRSLDGRLGLIVALSIDPAAPAHDVATGTSPGEPSRAVFLHIDSPNRDVRLHRYLGSTTGTAYSANGPVTVTTPSMTDECRAPCDRLIPEAESRFFVGGDGVQMAGPFVLADHQKDGRVTMKVRPGSSVGWFLGWYSAGFFGLGGIGGGIIMMAFSGPSSTYTTYGVGRGPSPGLLAAGIATLVAGVIVTVIGVIVGVTNTTVVTFEDDEP